MSSGGGTDSLYPYRRVWDAIKRDPVNFLNVGLISLILRLILYGISIVLVIPFIIALPIASKMLILENPDLYEY